MKMQGNKGTAIRAVLSRYDIPMDCKDLVQKVASDIYDYARGDEQINLAMIADLRAELAKLQTKQK